MAIAQLGLGVARGGVLAQYPAAHRWPRLGAAFPFSDRFPLAAVPWLVQFENAVVHALTRAVAFLAVEIAGWLGIAAYQVGNVIQLANGFVGVDEACSGVKTLQASIMVALFLGESLALSASRRIVLVAAGGAWVVACNVFRATALVVIAAQQGIAAMQQWHDAIGWAVLILGMGGLSAAAFFLSRKDQAVALAPAPATPPPRPFALARQDLVAALWLGTVFVLTELWYRAHEDRLIAQPAWEAHWPAEHGAQAVPIAETARAILRYNEASSAAWTTADHAQWWGFLPVGRRANGAPTCAQPFAGDLSARDRAHLQARAASETLTTGAGRLHIRGYEFEQNRQPLFVFVCIQEDKIAPDAATASGEWSARGRMLAAWRGQRNLGQRLIEVAVLGLDDFAQARAALEALAPKIVRSGQFYWLTGGRVGGIAITPSLVLMSGSPSPGNVAAAISV